MLDTIILMVEQGNCDILDYRKFGMTEIEFFEKPMTFKKYVNNPTAKDKRKGIYKPRLTLIKRIGRRRLERLLKIEFSAPKLIFGNNLEEVDEEDFDAVVTILKQRLYGMGVLISGRSIKQAAISSFHPSKNIRLTGGYTATLAINELSKINLTRKLDLNKTNFRNNGYSLQYYANSHSFVIYDKITDLNRPKRRAIDKDQTGRQLSLFKEIKKSNNHLEVLKMEVRLSNKRKMNSVLKRVGYPKNPRFQGIFKKDLCQKIVKLYWNEMVVENNLYLFDLNSNPQRLVKSILKEYPNVKTKQAIYLVGLNLLGKDKGIRELRNIIDSERPKTNWTRISKDLNVFNSPSFYSYQHGFVKDIQKGIEGFEPFRYDPENNLQCQ